MKYRSSDKKGFTILEIIIALTILGTMVVWIIQTTMGGIGQTVRTEENTLGAVAAATVMDRIRDCINVDPRFFSKQRLLEMGIPPDPEDTSRFVHWGLFVDRKATCFERPDEMPEELPPDLPQALLYAEKSRLFQAFDEIGEAVIATNTALSGIAFRLSIENEFSQDFPDAGASSMCRKACVDIFQLKDLLYGDASPTFRLTRSFLLPNLSLHPDEIRIIAVQSDIEDTEQAVEDVRKKIAPEMADLSDFPEAPKFAAALMLIAAEMNRLAFECRNMPLPGVATPTVNASELPFWGYETQIASLEPKLKAPDSSLAGVIKRATLHRRAATRILEAHKKCLGPSKFLKKMFEDLRLKLSHFVPGRYYTLSRDLRKTLEEADEQARLLAQAKTAPPDAVLVASAAAAIKNVVLESRNWDAQFNEGDNLRLLQLANIYNNFLGNLFHAVGELKSMPMRFINHLRAARDCYFDLLSESYSNEKQLSPHSLGVFANHAIEMQFALALVGTDTAETDRIMGSIRSDHRLHKEFPQLFREYWSVQVDTAKALKASMGAGSVRENEFRSRNAIYAQEVIPSLWGLHNDPESFSRLFTGGYPPEPVLRVMLDDFDSTQLEPDNWTVGGFINTTIDLYFSSGQRLGQFDRAMTNSDGTPTAARERVLEVLRNDRDCRQIREPSIEEMLATASARIPCPTLHYLLKPILGS